MKQFTHNFLVFFLLQFLLGSIFWVGANYVGSQKAYQPWNTEAHTYTLPENTHVGIVFLGTSHGRSFGEYANKASVEDLLNTSTVNISQGAAGVLPERVYLDFFYEKGNTAGTLVYFIDPWVLYSDVWNSQRSFSVEDPFSFMMLKKMYVYKFEPSVYMAYFQNKARIAWYSQFESYKRMPRREERFLSDRDQQIIDARRAFLYPDGENREAFARYSKALEDLILFAQSRDTRVIFILPPTLLGEVPGTKEVMTFLSQIPGVTVYDATSVIADPLFFYNHDHLNSSGVEKFTKEVLAPLLSSYVWN